MERFEYIAIIDTDEIFMPHGDEGTAAARSLPAMLEAVEADHAGVRFTSIDLHSTYFPRLPDFGIDTPE